jgi:chromosome segregation ATPase
MSTLAKMENTERPSPDRSELEELRSSLNRLMEAAAAWKVERAQLTEECEQLRQALSGNEEAAAIALERQISTSVERIRAELTAENERLRKESQRLTGSAADWEAERSRLKAELDHTRQLMGHTEEAAAIALERQMTTAVEKVKAEHAAETLELQTKIRQLETERNQMEETIASVQNLQQLTLKESEQAAAVSEQRVADAVHHVRMEFAAERDQLRQELDAAIQLSAQRAAECAQLKFERDRAQQSVAETAEVQRKTTAETLQREVASAVERVRQELTTEAETLRLQWEAARRQLESELQQVKGALTKAELARANALSDSEASDRKNSKLMEDCVRLRQELEKLSDEVSQKDIERDRLKEECGRAYQALAEAKSVQASQVSNGAPGELKAELTRVEELIHELSVVIDDPSSDLSVVIRKTVERAQQEAYLKGLRFTTTAGE